MNFASVKSLCTYLLAAGILTSICSAACVQGQTDLANHRTEPASQGVTISKEGIVTVELPNQRISTPGNGIAQLFLLSDKDEIFDNGKPHKIVRPESLSDQKLAYTRIYFKGRKGVIDDAIMVLVADYDSDQPQFVIDQNNNLDFSDDDQAGAIESKGGDHVLTLVGSDDESKFSIRLIPFRNAKDLNAEKKARFRNMFQGYLEHMGGTYADTDDWFYDQRLNTRARSFSLDGQELMLGLHDYDCDGMFSGSTDRLLIGEFGSKQLSARRADGAVDAKVGEIFLVGQTPYRIIEVEHSGGIIRIQKSDKMPDRLFNGSPLPNLNVKSLTGELVELKSFVKPGKLLVMDFWGHWCSPCVEAIPETIEFENKWKEQVTFVGVHSGDHDQAREIIKEKSIEWPQLEFTDELKDALFIDGWPTYVLIDSDGTILSFATSLKKIALKLQE